MAAASVPGRTTGIVVLVDVNHDAILDAITTSFGTKSLAVLFGNGDGPFLSARFYSVGDAPGGLAVADLNGDDVNDLVVTNSFSNDVSVILR